jgi:hypothetical protein
MDNFKIIYKVLRHLEKSLDCDEMDYSPIGHAALGISRERWEALLTMMKDAGYVDGLVVLQDISDNKFRLCLPICPRITLKGLEYLSDNSLMKKAANLAKGIAEIVS